MSGPRATESPAPPDPSRRPWWRTNRARVGFLAAIPLLGLIAPGLGAAALFAALVLVWRGSPWPKAGKVVATVAAAALLGSVTPEPEKDAARQEAADAKAVRPGAPAPSSPPPLPTPPPRPRPALPDLRGETLDVAFSKAGERGYTVAYHDASDEGKDIMARSLWTVCFQEVGGTGESPTVDFAAVHTGDPCPKADGAPLPWPVMPELVWKTWATARKEVLALGVDEDKLRAETAYRNDKLPDEGEYDHWRVCAHDPAQGAKVPRDEWVTLHLSSPDIACPEPDRGTGGGARLPDRDEDGDPDYLDPYPRDRNRTSDWPNGFPGGSGGSSGGSSGGGDGWSPCRHTRWC
ncbi:PASTA domain-containing protein [Streptomyces roseolilacinus]|uniref:PASTA domain-containing protein n=1 Tax=Streptomyces roseolilacinus TaxID=66904 RepID=UPI0037F5F189